MSLSFPNDSRSFDARRDVVRFWGHDSAMEIAFFVDVGAFSPDQKSTGDEVRVLLVFDASREHIHAAARRVYARDRKNVCWLTSSDFRGPRAFRLPGSPKHPADAED